MGWIIWSSTFGESQRNWSQCACRDAMVCFYCGHCELLLVRSCHNVRSLATGDGIVWYESRKRPSIRMHRSDCDFLYRSRSTCLRHTTPAPYLSIAINIVSFATPSAAKKIGFGPGCCGASESIYTQNMCITWAKLSWVELSEDERVATRPQNAINQAPSIRRW